MREAHPGERPRRSTDMTHPATERSRSEGMTGMGYGVEGDTTIQGWPAKPTKVTELTVPTTWSLRAKDTPCPVCGEQIEQLNGRQAAGVDLPEWGADPCGDRWGGKAVFDTEHGALMWEGLGQIQD
jgi:hypothetical protein